MAIPVLQHTATFIVSCSPTPIRVSPHVAAFLCNSLRDPNPNRVAAIQFIRGEYNLGLKDAKDIVDYYVEARRVQGPDWHARPEDFPPRGA